jgi:hypothetical protein
MVTLKKLASTGCTVIFTMYQSSTEVFGLFDRICLLSNGNTLFFGETLACLQVSELFLYRDFVGISCTVVFLFNKIITVGASLAVFHDKKSCFCIVLIPSPLFIYSLIYC